MTTMMEALDRMNYPDVPEEIVPDEVHDRVMKELQEECLGDNMHRHADQRLVMHGIRSSQISALVMYLIKKGVLK